MMQGDRPRVRPAPNLFDRGLNLCSILCITAGVVLILVFWDRLPDRIPIHFNEAGQADGWGARGMIWLLPSIALVLVPGMLVLQRFPWLSNVPVRIDTSNADHHYRLVIRLLSVLALAVAAMFLLIVIGTIAVALGHEGLMGAWMLPGLLAPTIGALGWYLVAMMRAPRARPPGDSGDSDQLSSNS